jgi:hypothetical protein
LLNINTEKVTPYWIFDVTQEQPAFPTSIMFCNRSPAISGVSVIDLVFSETRSEPYLCLCHGSIYCFLQNVWTPSKVIARLGKEINDESSYLYWAYKVTCSCAFLGSIKRTSEMGVF